MSDFVLQPPGPRPPPYRLFDQKLTLSPETEAFLARIKAELAAKEWMDQILNPKWHLDPFKALVQVPPITTSPPDPFLTMPLVPSPFPPFPPATDPFPPDPRPGEMKDVTAAIFKLPLVQGQSILRRPPRS